MPEKLTQLHYVQLSMYEEDSAEFLGIAPTFWGETACRHLEKEKIRKEICRKWPQEDISDLKTS